MREGGSKSSGSTRLLIVGVPRSGTSWLGRALAMSADASYVHEPDHERYVIAAMHAALDEGKIQHVFYESPGTDHEWQTWRRDLKDFAPRLFQPAGQQPASAHGK